MITEIVSMGGKPFKIWYENPTDRPDAINEIKSLQVGTNLVQNPGFETPGTVGTVPDSWTPFYTVAPPTLNYPASTANTGIAVGFTYAAPAGQVAGFNQVIPGITPARPYAFQFYSSTQNIVLGTGAAGVGAEVQWLDSTGAVITTIAVAGPTTVGNTNWTAYTGGGWAPANAASARIVLFASNIGGSVEFDDVVLEELPTSYNCVNNACTEIIGTNGSFPDLTACQTSGCGSVTYDCVNNTCTQILGYPPGPYADQTACQTSGCGAITYDCVNNTCTQVQGTGGQYADQTTCAAACVAVTPPTCPSGSMNLPVVGCTKNMYVLAGGVGIVALVLLMSG